MKRLKMLAVIRDTAQLELQILLDAMASEMESRQFTVFATGKPSADTVVLPLHFIWLGRLTNADLCQTWMRWESFH